MTVKSDYAIAIATCSDWLQNCANFSTNEKQNQNQNQNESDLVRMIFPALWAHYK